MRRLTIRFLDRLGPVGLGPVGLGPVGLGPVGLALIGHRGYARNRCRRIAATLPKIRTPRTTTTPVESWLPTPS